MRFEVLMSVGVEFSILWAVMLCSLVEVYRCFKNILLGMKYVLHSSV